MHINSTYTKETGVAICALISSSNKSISTVAKELDIPRSTIWHWIANVDEFRELYEKAKEQQADYLVEEMIEIADEPSKDLVDAQDRKLRVNTRQWAAAKLKPKKYGDNRNMNVDVNVRKVVSPEQMLELRKGMIQQLSAPKEDYEDAEEVE